MFRKIASVLLLTVFFSSTIALGLKANAEEVKKQEPAASEVAAPEQASEQAPVFEKEVVVEREAFSKEWWLWLGGIMSSLYVLLWALGEGLTRLSVWTENKWDNKLAAYVSQASWFLGAMLGRFGVSLPKLVIEDKIEQAAKKAEEKKSA